MCYHDRMVILAAAASFGLSGCTFRDGPPNQSATGPEIGGVTGVVAGRIMRGDVRATMRGAALHSPIGAQMAAQERGVRQSLAGIGTDMLTTVSPLLVPRHEPVPIRTRSSVFDPRFRPAFRAI